MTTPTSRFMLTISLAAMASLAAQESTSPAASNPMSAGTKFIYNMVKSNIVKAAENMPEENYAFKPTPDVRSFGQLVGHVADAQYAFCSAVAGEKKAPLGIEKKVTAKAELVEALQTAFAYCDKAYDGLTDTSAAEVTKFFGRDAAKISILDFNSAHNDEHYGNMVTYMRLKGLVPPSSVPPPKKPAPSSN